MVASMEEIVFHQEYVIVLMVGVELHVPYVCKIICEKWFLREYFYVFIKLFVLMVASTVENALLQGPVHVLLDGLVITAHKVRSGKLIKNLNTQVKART